MLKEPKCDINEGDNNDSSSISLSDNDVYKVKDKRMMFLLHCRPKRFLSKAISDSSQKSAF
jgi:hypothetical protein